MRLGDRFEETRKIGVTAATTTALDKIKDITLDIADVVKTGAEQGQGLQEMAEELFVRQMQTLGMESLFGGATRVTISETLDGNLGILKKFANSADDVADDVSDAARAARKIDTTDIVKPRQIEYTDVKYQEKSIQHSYKHAGDFGIEGNWSKANMQTYVATLKKHVNAASEVYRSTFRNKDVYVYIDATSGRGVYTDLHGNYVSGWKFSASQLKYHRDKGIKIEK